MRPFLLTRSQCRVSDTQVTIKACGPLVFGLTLAYYIWHMVYLHETMCCIAS